MTEVQKFYNGKRVFITGATGLLGKSLLEKLLRSTDVERVYVLIREKRRKTIQQRLQDLLKQSLFEELAKKSDQGYDQLLSRVTAVQGECGLPEMGLSTSDRDILLQNVNVIFHCAATVRFTEPLRVAALINTASTEEMLKLARKMINLKSFIHVSTLFVGCTQSFIDECINVVPKKTFDGLSAVDVSRRIRLMDDVEQDSLTPKLLGKYPNTYTFTKALSEEVIAEEAGDLPLAIVRPSIVVASYAEPHPGWVGNAFGLTDVMMHLMMGWLHVLKYTLKGMTPLVPIDYCVNAMIACGFRTAHEQRRGTPIVYNCGPEARNPTTWTEIFQMTIDLARKQPVVNLYSYPFMIHTESHLVQRLLRFLLHTLPMMTYNLLTCWKAKQNRSQFDYKHIHKFLDVADYFMGGQWELSTDNLRRLWASLDEKDQQMFPFDMLQVDWKQHIRNTCQGIRRHLLNEDPDRLDKGRKRYQTLRFVHYFILFVGMVFLAKALQWIAATLT